MFDLHKLLAPFTTRSHEEEIPPMDGPFQPNDRIEEASLYASVPGVERILAAGDWLYFSSANKVQRRSLKKKSKKSETVFEGSGHITCLAALGDGNILAGVQDRGIEIFHGKDKGRTIESVQSRALPSVTGIVADEDGRLFIANASMQHAAQSWTADLLSHGATGFVGSIDGNGGERILADGLSFAAGLAFGATQRKLLVSESWKHRLIGIDLDHDAVQQTILANLPGYPGQIISDMHGGYWLSLFALRTQLVEFILNQTKFRERMIREIDPKYWLAPSLRRSDHHMLPMQQGAVKKLGVVKPWAPPRSYGLVVKLDHHYRPVASFHSRANGKRHGVTSLTCTGECLYASSFGAEEIIGIPCDESGVA